MVKKIVRLALHDLFAVFPRPAKGTVYTSNLHITYFTFIQVYTMSSSYK